MNETDGQTSNTARLVVLAVIYGSFVVYGSLVPLEFHRRDLAEAWQAYLAMPFLNLGVGSRADWIANLLLYVPLAFLFQGALGGLSKSPIVRGISAATTLTTCLGLAAAVEFAQLFYPPRTVSLNDLVAEALGSLFGLLAWLRWGGAFLRATSNLLSGGGTARTAALWIYVLGYLALSLFPFDFVVSSSELSAKLNSGNAAWIIADGSRCDSMLSCTLKSFVEILGFLPFGVLLASRGPPRIGELGRSFAMGLGLGLAIELLQVFVASGISQGLSVITRGFGAAAGTMSLRLFQGTRFNRNGAPMRTAVLLIAPLYLIAVCYVSGWISPDWQDGQFASDQLAKVNWLPLYYHYFTSETNATVSLFFTAALYGLLGVAGWIWSPSNLGSRGMLAAGALAGVLAFVMEAGKLFLPTKHSDPTNILIAAIAAGFARWLCQHLSKPGTPPRPLRAAPNTKTEHRAAVPRRQHGDTFVHERETARAPLADYGNESDRAGASSLETGVEPSPTSPSARAMQIALFCATGFSILRYPFPIPLAIGVAAYIVLLWRYPRHWLIVVLAALPVLDFAPWSGRLFWDEFDILLLATLGCIAPQFSLSTRRYDSPFLTLIGFVALSYAIGLGIGLFPLSPLDGNAFNSYYSHYAGLRILKGFAWAVALLAIIGADNRAPSDVMRSFAWGMALGTALEVVFILWERVSFSGLFNFSNDYRVTGTFSAMHTGGAYIEAYLAAAIPFLIFLAISTRNLLVRGLLTGVFMGAVYALMVTFSRGGYAALVIALMTCAFGALFGAARMSDRFRRFVYFALLLGVASCIAVPILTGPYMKERFATVNKDFAVRSSHWSDALAFRDESLLHTMFGMGLGRYPEAYFWRNRDNVTPSAYRFLKEGDNTFLRLSAGDSLYFEQLVPIAPKTEYELSFDVRSVRGKGTLTVPICEKWMLYSFRCEWQSFRLDDTKSTWRHITTRFNSREMASGRWFAQRTVKLTLFENDVNAVIDVDNIQLTSGTSGNLVRNGAFDQGMDHWFFATDNHLPWHLKNLWVHLLFEQGWFGVATVGFLTLATAWILLPATLAGNFFATTLLAALLALLTVGVVDSLVDSPRHLLLFMLIVGLSFRFGHSISMRKSRFSPT